MSNYRKKVPLEVERKLYAESMGRCMNPDCLEPLFEGWSPVNKIDNLNRDFFVLCHD